MITNTNYRHNVVVTAFVHILGSVWMVDRNPITISDMISNDKI